jgi:hypothetical protein
VADVLLLWIYDKADGAQATRVDIAGFYPCLGPRKIEIAQSRLAERGLIELSWEYLAEVNQTLLSNHAYREETRRLDDQRHQDFMRNLDVIAGRIPGYYPPTSTPNPPPILETKETMPPEISLTAKGVTQAEQSRWQWKDRVFRNFAARDHLLAWLYDRADSESTSVAIAGFFTHPRSIVTGHFLSPKDVEGAMVYLCAQDLIRVVTNIVGYPGLNIVSITSHGVDCVERGGSVSEYLSSRQDQAKNINNIGSITAESVVIGDNNAVIGRIDASSLRDLAGAIGHVLSNRDLRAEDQKTAEAATGEIISETRASEPNRRRLHTALAKLRDILARAGNEALVVAVDHELAKLGLPR